MIIKKEKSQVLFSVTSLFKSTHLSVQLCPMFTSMQKEALYILEKEASS